MNEQPKEAPFEMANLFPKHTGLPFVVWISYRGSAKHDVRVKVSSGPKAIPEDMISVSIRPDIRIVTGTMDTYEFRLLKIWIERNQQTLVSYWEGKIDTVDALKALVKLDVKA